MVLQRKVIQLDMRDFWAHGNSGDNIQRMSTFQKHSTGISWLCQFWKQAKGRRILPAIQTWEGPRWKAQEKWCRPSEQCNDWYKKDMHQQQSSKVSSTLSTTCLAALNIPSYIPLDLTELQTMIYINRFPQKNSTSRIYPMSSLIFERREVCAPNDKRSIACIILCLSLFLSIGKPKPNQPLQPIENNPRYALSTWPPKCTNGSDPYYKTLASKSSKIQLPFMRTVNPQLIF